MGMIKGQNYYEKFEKGEKLTRAQAVKANCYSCNGFNESAIDCGCKKSCPLYDFSPYKGKNKEIYGKDY